MSLIPRRSYQADPSRREVASWLAVQDRGEMPCSHAIGGQGTMGAHALSSWIITVKNQTRLVTDLFSSCPIRALSQAGTG
jgi:hypothetical protein